jgi:ribose 5-phosphate isomerase B
MFEKKVIVIGSDHAGYGLKSRILEYLNSCNLPGVEQVIDIGCDSKESSDFPDFAKLVADTINSGNASFGILISGTGVEMSMAANRYNGIRAVLTEDLGILKMAREQTNANVLCLAGRLQPSEHHLLEMIKTFLFTNFDFHHRYARRISKMDEKDDGMVAMIGKFCTSDQEKSND